MVSPLNSFANTFGTKDEMDNDQMLLVLMGIWSDIIDAMIHELFIDQILYVLWHGFIFSD